MAGFVLNDSMFRTLLNNLSEGVYFVDPERIIRYWNRSAERITGYCEQEVIGRSCKDNLLMHANDQGVQLCLEQCPLAASICDERERNARVYLHHKDGHRLPVRVTVAPIHDAEGKVIGGLETFHDDTELVSALQEVEQLSQLALICPLTGAGNRRYSEEMISKKMEESRRLKAHFAMLLFDIDHFKKINDTYGHPVGDVVVKMVARTVMGDMRTYDFVGRWGGDEFVVLLPHMKPLELEPITNRLRALVELSSRQVSGNRLSVTISGGACIAHPDDTPDSIVKRVDVLLYESKRMGRNRIACDRSIA